MKACPQCFRKDVGFARTDKTDKNFSVPWRFSEELAGKLLQKESIGLACWSEEEIGELV